MFCGKCRTYLPFDTLLYAHPSPCPFPLGSRFTICLASPHLSHSCHHIRSPTLRAQDCASPNPAGSSGYSGSYGGGYGGGWGPAHAAAAALQQQPPSVTGLGQLGRGQQGQAAGAQGHVLPQAAGGAGQYACCAAYPSPQHSLKLGKRNLHLFRLNNTR